jgi:hypothetical protein
MVCRALLSGTLYWRLGDTCCQHSQEDAKHEGRRLLHSLVKSSWNVMAHGDSREGKWRGNWRMEWVASTLTLPRNVVYPALLTLMRTPRLPAVDWTDAHADLNGLVCFAERWNAVSARVPTHFKRSLPIQHYKWRHDLEHYNRDSFFHRLQLLPTSLLSPPNTKN